MLSRQQRDAVIVALARQGEKQSAIARRVGLRSQSYVSAILRRHGFEVLATDDPARLAKRERWRRDQRNHRARAAMVEERAR